MEKIEELYEPPRYRAKSFVYEPCDRYGNVNLQQLMLDFQDIAGINADDLDIGPSYYVPNRICFVICRMKGWFVKPVPFGEKVWFVTFALPIDEKIQFYRQAFACDSEGDVFFRLTSSWVMISAEKRRIVTTDALKEHILSVSPFVTENQPIAEKRLKALETIETTEENRKVYVVGEGDIDNNHHMNNTVYFKIMQNFGFRDTISSFEIDFEKESFAGEKICTGTVGLENSDYYIGHKEDGSLSFKANINY